MMENNNIFIMQWMVETRNNGKVGWLFGTKNLQSLLPFCSISIEFPDIAAASYSFFYIMLAMFLKL